METFFSITFPGVFPVSHIDTNTNSTESISYFAYKINTRQEIANPEDPLPRTQCILFQYTKKEKVKNNQIIW
jgi:hypothetical protein